MVKRANREFDVIRGFIGCAALCFAMLAGSAVEAATAAKPTAAGGPIAMRRLTEAQYRQSVADIFGSDVNVTGRFEPDSRKDGLLAIGTAWVTVTPAGLEQYDLMARGIAAQVVDEKHRGTLFPCTPVAVDKFDATCARRFFERSAKLLLRRPPTLQEIDSRIAIAKGATASTGNFYTGVSYGLASLLSSPEYLFRVETAQPGPGGEQLTAFTKASRISYLLWNSTPDEELLNAAEKGELNTKPGLSKQVTRMMRSPKFETGLRAFFTDMLQFDLFREVIKDPEIYPAFSAAVATDAQEETLRVIVQQLIDRGGDYRDLFTLRSTQMTRLLGSLYGVPVAKSSGWQEFQFVANSRSTDINTMFAEDVPVAGLLTQASFMMLHSHPGRSSATLRGKAIRETFLCQKVPDPPGNVDFKLVEDTHNPQLKTLRDRLTAHRANPVCAGCHKITDPIGLTLENFDGIGAFRTMENGEPIDGSGEVNGRAVKTAFSLGQVLHDDPQISSCLVHTVFGYAAGRVPEPSETASLKALEKTFQKSGYNVPELLREMVLSDDFYKVSGSRGGAVRTGSGPALKTAAR
jgi:hypothetical protein